MQPKWHYGELELESSWGSECHVSLTPSVSRAEIKDGDVFGSSDLFQQVLNSWHGVSVKLRDGIELLKINAYTE